MTHPFRIVPPEIEALLPPHRIEFHPDDPNVGRSCGACGFAVPQGMRYVHQEWCEAQRASRRYVVDGWTVTPYVAFVTLVKGLFSMSLVKDCGECRLYIPHKETLEVVVTPAELGDMISTAIVWADTVLVSEKLAAVG